MSPCCPMTTSSLNCSTSKIGFGSEAGNKCLTDRLPEMLVVSCKASVKKVTRSDVSSVCKSFRKHVTEENVHESKGTLNLSTWGDSTGNITSSLGSGSTFKCSKCCPVLELGNYPL
mmetsp:Transcript_8653/g.17733  ORF Transcript_8653/g.17733 Transcript_8653/m.17733 type:complete len:116 (+) Transcript_8653:666-1013(+)